MPVPDSAPSTSESLLIRIRNPLDADAWRLFVDLYTPMIYRYGCRRGLQEADARDVVQEVLTRVNRAIREFDYDRDQGQFRAWLGTIASRVVLTQLRNNNRHDRAPGDGGDEMKLLDVEGGSDPIWLDEYRLQLMRTALDRIRAEFDPTVWQAFEQTWLHHQSVAATTLSLGKTAAWVYKAKFNVLSRLKEELRFLANDVGLFHQE